MRPPSRHLTEQELEIMKLVWQLGSATVRDVYEALREQRQVAYTTVSTMMTILENKGHLGKEPQGRAFLYTPTRSKAEALTRLIEDFVDRVFDGAAQPLVLSLVRERKLSKADLAEITRLVEEVPERGKTTRKGEPKR